MVFLFVCSEREESLFFFSRLFLVSYDIWKGKKHLLSFSLWLEYYIQFHDIFLCFFFPSSSLSSFNSQVQIEIYVTLLQYMTKETTFRGYICTSRQILVNINIGFVHSTQLRCDIQGNYSKIRKKNCSALRKRFPEASNNGVPGKAKLCRFEKR